MATKAAAAKRETSMTIRSGGGERAVEYVPLVELKRAKRNPKDHDLGALAVSMTRLGFLEPLILDERTGRLIGGHGRLELLAKLEGQKAAPPEGVKVSKDGEFLVPVVRGWASQTDAEAEAAIIALNRIGEKGGWEQSTLADVLRDLQKAPDLFGVSGYDGDDLDRLLEDLGEKPRPDFGNHQKAGLPSAPAGETESLATSSNESEKPEVVEPVEDPDDKIPSLSNRPWVKRGELYELGEHRLLCGDSFDKGDRARLFGDRKGVHAVISDPPYAIYGSSTGIGADIADDKMIRPFFDQLLRILFDAIPLFAHVYLCCDWRTYPTIAAAGKVAELSAKNCLVWDKGGSGLGSNWANTYELIAYFAKIPPQKAMKSSNKITGQRPVHRPNVLRFPRPSGDERQHNAAKPVGLMAELVTAATEPGQVIFEPFAGSGSTLMACEREGRRCLAMEIEPKFAQVVIERWQKKTGKEAKKVEP